jgi:hypothetical protein
MRLNAYWVAVITNRIAEVNLDGEYNNGGFSCSFIFALKVQLCLFKEDFNDKRNTGHLQVFSCGTFLPAHPDKEAEDTNRIIRPLATTLRFLL